ncbi:MAG: hypothetical protein GX640_07375 [Fibrobacter sp.]|nr:hypothetical protein [Fibrobacter sp.]
MNTLLVIFSLIIPTIANDKLVLHFFGSPTCGECLEIKQTILYPFAKSSFR